MATVKCIVCGGEVPIPEGEPGGKVTVTCHHCRSRLQVSIPADIGAETLFHPQLLSEELTDEPESAEGVGGAEEAPSPRVGSGTILVDSGKPPATPRVETTMKGYLIHAGAIPGEERLALTAAKTVVGREEADIVIDDSALSSRHFEVEARGNEFFIRDLDSRNGTFVNGNRIRAAELTSGDKIRVGQTDLTFRTQDVVRWDGT